MRFSKNSLEILNDVIGSHYNKAIGKIGTRRFRKNVPDDYKYWAVNTTGQDLYPGYILEVTGYNRSQNRFSIQVPSEDDCANIAIVLTRAMPGERVAIDFSGTHEVYVDGGYSIENFVVGSKFGSIEDSFLVKQTVDGPIRSLSENIKTITDSIGMAKAVFDSAYGGGSFIVGYTKDYLYPGGSVDIDVYDKTPDWEDTGVDKEVEDWFMNENYDTILPNTKVGAQRLASGVYIITVIACPIASDASSQPITESSSSYSSSNSYSSGS